MDDRPPDNIFRFRRLKWGAPRRLRGALAIDPAPPGIARGGSAGWLVLVAIVLAAAIGMKFLGWL